MKILVTGGAGFIGSALVRFLINNTNNTAIIVDSLTYAGNLESLEAVSKSDRYFFENVDICNKFELEDIFVKYKPDKVMHLAAESHVDRSISGPDVFIKTNILGTYNLLEVSRAYLSKLNTKKKSLFRFHHISTDEVYGDLENDDDFFTENTPYAPSSPYSASKAASDHLVRAWYKTYNFPAIVTNCSNNYGPYHFPEKLIPFMIHRALSGMTLPVYGSGDNVRDWLYVDDHACALYKVVTKGKIGQTYNIGGNNEKTNIEVVKLICKILDELTPLNNSSYMDQIAYVSDRPGHDRRYAIDSTKIATELDWVPTETFESGLRKTVIWFLKNKTWTEKVLNK